MIRQPVAPIYVAGAGKHSKRSGLYPEAWREHIWILNTDSGYHGYWAKDLYQIAGHFGTEHDLKDLVDECHRKGIWVMVVMIQNHMGYLEMILGKGLVSDSGPLRYRTWLEGPRGWVPPQGYLGNGGYDSKSYGIPRNDITTIAVYFVRNGSDMVLCSQCNSGKWFIFPRSLE